ncbi:hypothetical protein [Endozoicomonas sp. SESOKO1]|uniref:hypothetical protein n=1 Tax=Endozoicomonas sp. SESOKO1 TaxID=2828742 RepID=UPI002147DA5A|nr:hypothetical protein [Endozoicomonas sp. SESOKO1]
MAGLDFLGMSDSDFSKHINKDSGTEPEQMSMETVDDSWFEDNQRVERAEKYLRSQSKKLMPKDEPDVLERYYSAKSEIDEDVDLNSLSREELQDYLDRRNSNPWRDQRTLTGYIEGDTALRHKVSKLSPKEQSKLLTVINEAAPNYSSGSDFFTGSSMRGEYYHDVDEVMDALKSDGDMGIKAKDALAKYLGGSYD